MMVKGLFSIPFDHGLLLEWGPTSHPAQSQAPLEFFAIFYCLSGKFLANMLTQKPWLGLILGWINLVFLAIFIQSSYKPDQGMFGSAQHIEHLWGGTKTEIQISI